MLDARRLYRALFALGVGLTAISFAAGLFEAWRNEQRLPGLAQSPFAAAERWEREGEQAAAAREYRAAARLNGASLSQTLRAAEQLAWLGDLGGATELLATADRRAPGSPQVKISLGWILVHQRRFDAAEQTLRAALESVPEEAHGWAGLGEALVGRGHGELAIEAFRQALTLDPRRADVHNNLGIALATAGRPEQAIREFEAAMSIAPSPEYQANLERARGELEARSGGGESS